MKFTENSKSYALVAVGVTSLLTLTACSGGSEGYDFTEPLAEGVPSIEFAIPEGIIELDESYAESRFLDSVVLSSTEPEDPSKCAVEYRFNYADGGLERLLEQAENSDQVLEGEMTVEERMSRDLLDMDLENVELAEDYGSAVKSVGCSTSPEDTAPYVPVLFQRNDEEGMTLLASADVTVMRSGDLYIHETEVRGWEMDSDGNWLEAPYL